MTVAIPAQNSTAAENTNAPEEAPPSPHRGRPRNDGYSGNATVSAMRHLASAPPRRMSTTYMM